MDALLQRVAYLLYNLGVDEVQQALGLFARLAENVLNCGLAQNLDEFFESVVGGVEGADDVLEITSALIIGARHATTHLVENVKLLENAVAQEGGLRREDDGFLVHLGRRGSEVVGAQDEGHGGEGLFGGQEVFDEDFNGDVVGVELGRVSLVLRLEAW